MFTNSPSTLTFCPLQKTDLSWLNNLFMARFQLIRMSSYAKNKLQMCSVTQHQCRRRQMCGKCSQIHPVTLNFCPLQKTTCPWLNNLVMARFQLNRMSSYANWTNNRCFQSFNISVDVAKCVENVHKFTQFTHFLSVTKYYLCWVNNLFMARFQLIRMSSYATNKLQMCSVTQHQCRRRQICGKCSQIHPFHSLFVCYKKWLVLTEQSIHGKVSTQ